MFSHCGVFTSVNSVAFCIKPCTIFIPYFTEDVEFLEAGGGVWRGVGPQSLTYLFSDVFQPKHPYIKLLDCLYFCLMSSLKKICDVLKSENHLSNLMKPKQTIILDAQVRILGQKIGAPEQYSFFPFLCKFAKLGLQFLLFFIHYRILGFGFCFFGFFLTSYWLVSSQLNPS